MTAVLTAALEPVRHVGSPKMDKPSLSMREREERSHFLKTVTVALIVALALRTHVR